MKVGLRESRKVHSQMVIQMKMAINNFSKYEYWNKIGISEIMVTEHEKKNLFYQTYFMNSAENDEKCLALRLSSKFRDCTI